MNERNSKKKETKVTMPHVNTNVHVHVPVNIVTSVNLPSHIWKHPDKMASGK